LQRITKVIASSGIPVLTGRTGFRSPPSGSSQRRQRGVDRLGLGAKGSIGVETFFSLILFQGSVNSGLFLACELVGARVTGWHGEPAPLLITNESCRVIVPPTCF